MKIGQLCLLRLTSPPAENPYGSASVGSKYQGQRGPTPIAVISELSSIRSGRVTSKLQGQAPPTS